MTHPDPNYPDIPRHARTAPAKGDPPRVTDPDATLPPSREDEARDRIEDTSSSKESAMLHLNDRVRWFQDSTRTGTVTSVSSHGNAVAVQWDDGSGYEGSVDPIDRIDPAQPVTVDDVPTDLDDPLLGGM